MRIGGPEEGCDGGAGCVFMYSAVRCQICEVSAADRCQIPLDEILAEINCGFLYLDSLESHVHRVDCGKHRHAETEVLHADIVGSDHKWS